ncbi:hypothetical protein Mapa_002024 [Marchantia paleacea]|nr:hypothetical protein Mapa_002024 [Marchantia paleacea]
MFYSQQGHLREGTVEVLTKCTQPYVCRKSGPIPAHRWRSTSLFDSESLIGWLLSSPIL